MFFKVQNFFNINSRLPLVQESFTSTKYFVINSIGNSSIQYTKFLPVDFEVTLYNSVRAYCLIYILWPQGTLAIYQLLP